MLLKIVLKTRRRLNKMPKAGPATPDYYHNNTLHSLDPLNSRCLLPLIPIEVVESGAWNE